MGNTLNAFSDNPLRIRKSKKLSLVNKIRIKSFGGSRGSSVSSTPSTPTSRLSESSYRYIDGRRYNEKSKYSLPNDDDEIDRLQLQHYLQRYILQANYSSPIQILKRPDTKVLDVGCGPGTWLLEMAHDYPNADFTGVDISPMYPKEIKPNNVNFEEADLTKGLPFPDNTFDFVVMRNMLNALSVDDWEDALRELERVCKPGGFVECLEFEIPGVNLGNVTKRMAAAYIQLMRTKNIDITIAPRLGEIFTRCTKLVNINHQFKKVPMGNWGGRVGEIMAEDLILVARAMAPTLIPLWGIGTIHYQESINGLVRELNERKSYCHIHSVFAQKYEPYIYF